MAFRNRKLFPSSNETAYCSDLCDPACPYYYYECPDLYFSPPPSPPLHPSVRGTQSSSVSPSLITACSLLGGFFILLGYYVIIRKRCFIRRRRSNQSQALPGPGNGELLEENRVDHHIWFIATVGLQQSIINAISVCEYRKGEGLIEGSECSVCLNDFQEGELLRLLPKCSHAFHVRCIDTWLRSHTNCPLCRANILSPPTVSEQSAASRPQMERPGEEVDSNREARMADSRERGEAEENLDRDLSLVDQQETEESQQEVTGEVVLKDCCTHDEVEEIKQDQIESERHLISDSSSSSSTFEYQVYVDVPKSPESTDGLKVDAGDNIILKTEASEDLASTGKCAVVARSHSCGSGFFLSRHSRNSSSILPY